MPNTSKTADFFPLGGREGTETSKFCQCKNSIHRKNGLFNLDHTTVFRFASLFT